MQRICLMRVQVHPLSTPTIEIAAPCAGPAAAGAVRGVVARPWNATFLRQHLFWPLVLLGLASALLMGLCLDQTLADGLYALQGHAWRLQSAFLTQGLLHQGGRRFAQMLWLLVLVGWAASFGWRPLTSWRRPLAYLLLSVLVATVLVGLLKRVTHMDCPWDLLRYGGSREYYGLLSRRPLGLGSSGCFPAGHAGAGYAWIATYFCLFATAPRWRWWGLGFGLGLGLAFGLAQQLRGAHFLSHDLWALAVAWLVGLLLYRLVLVGRGSRTRQGLPR